MLPTRIGQAVVIVLAAAAVAGGIKSLLTASDTSLADDAAARALYSYQLTIGAPGAANAQLTQTATEYMSRLLGGRSTKGLTIDNYPVSTDPLDVRSVRVHSIIPATQPAAAGALYMVTMVAEAVEREGLVEKWYSMVMVMAPGPTGPRALVATAGRPIEPPAEPPVSVWRQEWEPNPDGQLVTDLRGFFSAYLTGEDRLDIWVTADSGIEPALGFQGAEVSILAVGTIPAGGGDLLARVLVDVGQPYEYVVLARPSGGRYVVARVDPVPSPILPQQPDETG